jgi:DHA1 family inner membrane transport protein
MAFFRNSAINLLNLHYAIMSVAIAGGSAFYAVYLIKAGLSDPLALVALGLTQAVRFVIRPVVLVVAIRFGLRRTLIAGAVLSALQYPFLAEVNGIGAVLYGLVLVTAIADVFYWSSYHAYFARLGDDEHRGSQVGEQMAAMTLVGIFSPILTGWLLVTFGPRTAFDASAVAVLVSVVPLFFTPDIPIARHVEGGFRAARFGILLFIADGWQAAMWVFVWQIALYLALGSDLLGYGGALALAAVVGAIGGLALGRTIDAGHGVRMVWIAMGLAMLMVGLRTASLGSPFLALVANALGPLATCLYVPALMTPVYTMAKQSRCVLRFHIATEGGWDVGNVAGCFMAAAMIGLGAPLWTTLLLPAISYVALLPMLRRYYSANPQVPIGPVRESAAHP